MRKNFYRAGKVRWQVIWVFDRVNFVHNALPWNWLFNVRYPQQDAEIFRCWAAGPLEVRRYA